MKYYKVIAKFGHVGRNNFILKDLFIKAENKKEAAAIARSTARVKHDHKDAIYAVLEISFDEYISGKKQTALDPYRHCSCIQDQRRLNAVTIDEVMRETTKVKYKKRCQGQYIRFEAILKESKRNYGA